MGLAEPKRGLSAELPKWAVQSDTRLDLLQPDSASDQQFFASDPPGVFGRQEQRGLGDVFARAHAPQRRSRDRQLLKAILVLRH